jgi:hypothetical protein
MVVVANDQSVIRSSGNSNSKSISDMNHACRLN